MGPKCTECFYCRRGAIVTWEVAFTCLHPLSRELGEIGHLAETCATMRSAEGACGKEGALFRPSGADTPEPIHKFRN